MSETPPVIWQVRAEQADTWREIRLEALLGDLIALGFTCDTSIVLSTPLEGKLLLPPQDA